MITPGRDKVAESTTGVILAGGASSRFGSNKALASLDGRPIIAHAADILSQIFTHLLLVTNTPDTYRFLGWPMTGDIHPGQGPLAGIHTALQTIQTEKAFVIACDMPRISAGLITHLCNLQGNWDVALPWLETGPEPLFAVYRKSCLPIIEKQLAAGHGKIRLALQQLNLLKIDETEILPLTHDLLTFHNINRTDDLTFLQEKERGNGQ
ncbi:MAG: molybdenum cofactor guanylyltransferase [Pseudomonadota bacterium]